MLLVYARPSNEFFGPSYKTYITKKNFPTVRIQRWLARNNRKGAPTEADAPEGGVWMKLDYNSGVTGRAPGKVTRTKSELAQ